VRVSEAEKTMRACAHTAHLAPSIQLPPWVSPFLRTARMASAGPCSQFLKQFMSSACGAGSDASPRDLKNSTVTLYLSEDDVEHWGRLRNRGRSRTRTSEGGIQGRALPRAFGVDMSSLDEPD
jgi:hypothetical protein